MTKQEEIREGIINEVAYCYMWDDPPKVCADKILKRLVAQDVVIKVDRELPKPRYPHTDLDAYCWEAQTDMIDAGYVAVEPLI